ncbi:hypothetical protein DFJ74DRAFT_123140 [Hyaloraphidium curvatum]|nr:hypothetical protein DFJ74DRAFT_123140 [Hyaloraphidium curvatum]
MDDAGEKPLLKAAATGTQKGVEEDSMAAAPPPRARRGWLIAAALGALLLVGLIVGLGVGLGTKSADASSSTAQGATLAADSGSPKLGPAGGNVSILYVGSELKDCTGMMPMKCMQVRDDPSKPWLNFFGDIRNFTYEPGFVYTLRVEKTRVPNPPADGSSIIVTCLEVISKVGLPDEKPEIPPLEGTEWQLVAFPAHGGAVASDRRGPPTLQIQGGRAAGMASVNRFSGEVNHDDRSISFGRLAMTRMMGPEALMRQEQLYASLLANSTAYSIHMLTGSPKLDLLNSSGTVVLTFAPKEAGAGAGSGSGAASTLLGTSWTLKLLGGNPPRAERIPTLQFSDSEPVRASGLATVNRYSASATIDGSKLSFGKDMVMTMMAADPRSMEQESQFTGALGRVATWEVAEVVGKKQLTLKDEQGEAILVFQ